MTALDTSSYRATVALFFFLLVACCIGVPFAVACALVTFFGQSISGVLLLVVVIFNALIFLAGNIRRGLAIRFDEKSVGEVVAKEAFLLLVATCWALFLALVDGCVIAALASLCPALNLPYSHEFLCSMMCATTLCLLVGRYAFLRFMNGPIKEGADNKGQTRLSDLLRLGGKAFLWLLGIYVVGPVLLTLLVCSAAGIVWNTALVVVCLLGCWAISFVLWRAISRTLLW